MTLTRSIITDGHAQRAQNGLKVRQPLRSVKVEVPELGQVEVLEYGRAAQAAH